jgi:hypothetical protein
MNHLASRMIGGINSSMQNRIALVDERFISEALSSFVGDADHPDCPSDRSAGCLRTQIPLEIVLRSIRHFLICAKNFGETDPLAADWLFGGQKAAPPSVFLCHERLCR